MLREEKSDNQCETTSDINALKDKVTTILPEQKDNDDNINDNKDKSDKGSHHFKKVQFFLTLFKRPLTPPPFYLNICPILQGVFFKRVFEHLI